jgi:hypothetical protein
MNRIISMIIRQLINVGIRRGMGAMAGRGARTQAPRAGGQGANANVKRAAKIARRTMR